jgi:gas vesicle protein
MKGVMSFMQGFLLGALLGASLALLLTPASGEHLRKQMQDEARRIQSEVTQAANDRRHDLEQQLAALRTPQK